MSFLIAIAIVPAGVRGLLGAGLVRENFRGSMLAFPLGAILVFSSIVALAPLALLNDRAGLELLDPDLRRWIVYLIGIAFLGLLDDGLGLGATTGTPRGWRGHASAIAAGNLSTGVIKAVGALALALYVVTGTGNELPMFLADVLLLILLTNLFNLLDLRGGRVEKVLFTLVAAVCLVAGTWLPIGLVGVFIGPFLVGFWFTVRERAMLGDTGSNLAGALAGVILLTTLDDTGRLVALAIVVALTIFAEFFSITRTLEKIPPLRFIDSLGRPSGSGAGGPLGNEPDE